MKFLEKKINVENLECFVCQSKFEIDHKKVSLDQPNIDTEVIFYAPIIKCSVCKTEELAPEYNEIQHEASCLANEVLNAREVKEIRDKLNLIEPWGSNNQDFSLVLGFGSSTIARYETCKSVPSMTHSNAIKAVMYEEYRENVIKNSKPYRQYLERSKNKKSNFIKKGKSDTVLKPILDTTNVYQLPGTDLNKIFKNQHIEKSLEINTEAEENFILSSFPEEMIV